MTDMKNRGVDNTQQSAFWIGVGVGAFVLVVILSVIGGLLKAAGV